MFEETVEQPIIAVEIFGCKICEGCSVLVAFWFRDG